MFSKLTVEVTVSHEHAPHVRRDFNNLLDYLTLRHTLIFDCHVATKLIDAPSDSNWKLLVDEEARPHRCVSPAELPVEPRQQDPTPE